ncbi:bifunctional (p)ppGpp synthetase/guanosine-3',5'-bis(diphosphate) 3'-pyrophosphohydrolase [Candidatus Woesearchaeota archaeon]|nr:bifunctional (p)ppGpp synthetase/guanosine-3',5'-bis(diphosphate) 3'-pyrophosphohydrolase [Candidatus Woesearchaeota archaeon]
MQLQDLLKKVQSYGLDTELIKKAYTFAEKVHSKDNRLNKEPFIQHPLNVAFIMAELKLDEPTICAALLHDTIKVESIKIEDLTNTFGKEIASLVEAVNLISSIKNLSREEYQAEIIRKVILASVKDIRVILIKLADRIHNLRTIDVFPEERRKKIAQDILEIYAPIAHKLGIASLKWELEDLAFKQLQPEIYNDLFSKIKKTQKDREKEIEYIKSILDFELKKQNIICDISGRPKHIYSIYKKMLKKNYSFEKLMDLTALRIITDTKQHCYELLGIIHSLWIPVQGNFVDYIASPKSNMYQSLHTVVTGPTKKSLEIQIRTQEMHDLAEKGIAAHWKYKGIAEDKEFDQKLKWMLEINALQKDSKDAKEFLKSINVDLFEDELFALTPKGKIILLPKGSTIVDFAYAVHSDLGDKCIAAKINGTFVPLRATLKNGDLIEIITSKTQHPSRDWLKFVKTSKAISKIKKYILETKGLHTNVFRDNSGSKKELEECIIKVDSMLDPKLIIAKCCHPLPGEKIIGLIRAANKIAIHKSDCNIIKKTILRKRIGVHWIEDIGNKINLKVDAEDRSGLFTELLNCMIAFSIPVKQAKAKPISDEYIECTFSIEIQNLKHLQELIQRLKKIRSVRKIFIELI